MNKITIFGATGKLHTQQALANGYEVIVFACNPAKSDIISN